MPYARNDYSAAEAKRMIQGATSTDGPKPHASIHARKGALVENTQFSKAAAIHRVRDPDEPDKTSMIVGDQAVTALRTILNHASFQPLLAKLDKGHLLSKDSGGNLDQNQERNRVGRFKALQQAWENPTTDLTQQKIAQLTGQNRPSTQGITTGMRNEFTNYGSVSVKAKVRVNSVPQFTATETQNTGGMITSTGFSTRTFFLKLKLNPHSRDIPLLQTFYPVNTAGGGGHVDYTLN